MYWDSGNPVRSASVDYLNNITDHDRGILAQQFELSYTEFREPEADEREVDVGVAGVVDCGALKVG